MKKDEIEDLKNWKMDSWEHLMSCDFKKNPDCGECISDRRLILLIDEFSNLQEKVKESETLARHTEALALEAWGGT